MKGFKGRIIFIVIFFGLLKAFPAGAEERVDDFRSIIRLNEDSSFSVTEEITYNFGNEQKHGIFRDIIYSYEAGGGNYKIRLEVESVADEKGAPYEYNVFKAGSAKRIRIGSEDRIVSGQKKYIIRYRVKRAVNYFDDRDEIYWNATGHDWTAPVMQSQALVRLPGPLAEDSIRTACYSGPAGSRKDCVSKRYLYSGKDMVESVSFIDDRLDPGSGLTFVLSLPKGVLAKPSFFSLALEVFKDNWILGLPILTFFFMLYLWREKGRDPEGRGAIITQFEAPDGLSPAEVGTVLDERAGKNDISAEVIYLAANGYIKIHQIEKLGLISNTRDYVLEKLKDFSDIKNDYERELLEAIFVKEYIDKTASKISGHDIKSQIPGNKNMVMLSRLKNKFYKNIPGIEDKIYRSVLSKGYFPKNPKKIRAFFTGIGVVILVLGWFSGPIFDIFGMLGIAISGIFIIIFGMYMPKKTVKGVRAREHILGLKDYLEVAEKDRLRFHNAPAKNPRHFEALLPYAMVLGVEKEWAGQFSGIYDQEPSWYSSGGRGGFSALALSNSLGDFSRQADSSLAGGSGSAGGKSGFSGSAGGGFGGGGGGSW